MVLHPVLETMIVEIGKGVQQVCFALHPLKVGAGSSSLGSKRRRHRRIAP